MNRRAVGTCADETAELCAHNVLLVLVTYDKVAPCPPT
jgi:hypothetical protein